MTRSIAHSANFLLARAATENEREPDWPATARCRRCGANTWRVVTPDGEDVVLDTAPIEVELGGHCDGDVRRVRSSVIWKEACVVDGWRLEDPVEAVGSWLWGATSATLAQALVEPLYSEHVYTCSAASEREVRSMVAGSPRATAVAARGAKTPKRPRTTVHVARVEAQLPRIEQQVVRIEAQLPAAPRGNILRLPAVQLSLWGG